VTPDDDKSFELIKKLIKKDLQLIPVPGFSPGTKPLSIPVATPRTAASTRHAALTSSIDIQPPATSSFAPRPKQIAALFLPPKKPSAE